LWALMPQRWPNISILCFLPLLLATLGWEKKSFRLWITLVAIAAIFVFRIRDFFPYYTLWFITCVIIFVGLLSSSNTDGKQIAFRNHLLSIVIFLVPVMCVSSFIFLVYYEGPYWFWGNIGFGVCAGITALFLGRNLDDNTVANRWFIYSSILFSLSGFSVLIAFFIFSYEPFNSILVVSAILLVFFGVVMFLYRKRLVSSGTNFLCLAGKRVNDISLGMAPILSMKFGRQKLIHYSAISFVLMGCLYLLIGQTNGIPWKRLEFFDDRTNNVFWEEIQNREGILLTGPAIMFVQLRTRRPVLLDTGTLLWLPYLLEAGPAVESILSEVYDIDYFNPPDGRKSGGLHPHWGKEKWLHRTRKDWFELKERFDIMDVLVHDDWILDLPTVTTGQGYVLYTIP